MAEFKRFPGVAAAALAALALGSAASSAEPTEGTRKISIDASQSIGVIRPLQGVNGVPAPGHSKPFSFRGGKPRDQNIDVSKGYAAARINIVRTHDAYGAGDIDARFGRLPIEGPFVPKVSAERDALDLFPNMDADPENPARYNFGPTDKIIASIKAIGAEPLFRLGRSEGALSNPPPDFDKYAAIVKHIVLHYNQGWAHGFHYGIRYWEVWNEPDLGPLFWGGTPQQYYELYAKLARAVKAADPTAKVGGPTLAFPLNAGPYREGFLSYVRERNVPLDFYPWHWYVIDSGDPYELNRIADSTQAVLDTFGFTKAEQVVDEWNIGFTGDASREEMPNTAYMTSALIYMQDSPIDVQALYRSDEWFGADGATPNKRGRALIALGRMLDTPVRLLASGADINGLAVIAGRSNDGKLIRVLISNYESPKSLMGARPDGDVTDILGLAYQVKPARRTIQYRDNQGYELSISGLPPQQRFRITRFRLDAGADLTPQEDAAGPQAGTIDLAGKLLPPGVELIELRAVD